MLCVNGPPNFYHWAAWLPRSDEILSTFYKKLCLHSWPTYFIAAEESILLVRRGPTSFRWFKTSYDRSSSVGSIELQSTIHHQIRCFKHCHGASSNNNHTPSLSLATFYALICNGHPLMSTNCAHLLPRCESGGTIFWATHSSSSRTIKALRTSCLRWSKL